MTTLEAARLKVGDTVYMFGKHPVEVVNRTDRGAKLRWDSKQFPDGAFYPFTSMDSFTLDPK